MANEECPLSLNCTSRLSVALSGRGFQQVLRLARPLRESARVGRLV